MDDLSISFSDFVIHLYKNTNRLYLPTQLADSVFTAPDSVMVIFREYPFAKYEVDVTLEQLKSAEDPTKLLEKMLSEFEVEEIQISYAE